MSFFRKSWIRVIAVVFIIVLALAYGNSLYNSPPSSLTVLQHDSLSSFIPEGSSIKNREEGSSMPRLLQDGLGTMSTISVLFSPGEGATPDDLVDEITEQARAEGWTVEKVSNGSTIARGWKKVDGRTISLTIGSSPVDAGLSLTTS